MNTVVAEFDGRVFVPEGPIDLPAGTKVAIPLPLPPIQPPRPPTSADHARWDELVATLNATEPHFPTVEDAIGYSRGRPGFGHP